MDTTGLAITLDGNVSRHFGHLVLVMCHDGSFGVCSPQWCSQNETANHQ